MADTSDMINVGERGLDLQHRVRLGKDVCAAHGIAPGDRVEVWIKKVK